MLYIWENRTHVMGLSIEQGNKSKECTCCRNKGRRCECSSKRRKSIGRGIIVDEESFGYDIKGGS
jgi:hypothetical protein